MLTDKGEHHRLIYLHSGLTDCNSENVWTEKGQKKEQIVRLLLQMNQRSAFGWTHECVLPVCFCAVYMPDCQTPYIETARVQEMTMIMPNVPLASAFLVVMDMVCNKVEIWPHIKALSIRFCHSMSLL